MFLGDLLQTVGQATPEKESGVSGGRKGRGLKELQVSRPEGVPSNHALKQESQDLGEMLERRLRSEPHP